MRKLAAPIVLVMLCLSTTFTAAQDLCGSQQMTQTILAALTNYANMQADGSDPITASRDLLNALAPLNNCPSAASTNITPTDAPPTDAPPTEELPPEEISTLIPINGAAAVYASTNPTNRLGDFPQCSAVSVIQASGNWRLVDGAYHLKDDDPSSQSYGWVYADLLASGFKGRRLPAPAALTAYGTQEATTPLFNIAAGQALSVLNVAFPPDNSEEKFHAMLSVDAGNGQIGWIPATTFIQSLIGQTVDTVGLINIRKLDSVNAESIVFTNGRPITLLVVEFNGNGRWLRVERHLQGYIDAKYLSPTFRENTPLYTSGNATLRAEANTNSPQLDVVIPAKTAITVEDNRNNEWLKVTFRERTGWINTCWVADRIPE